MSEALDRLQAEKEKAERELAQTQHKIQRLKNRKQYYEKGERRARSHRLITRGAAVESIVPEVKGMSETDFYSLMSDVLTMPEVAKHIRAAAPQKGGE